MQVKAKSNLISQSNPNHAICTEILELVDVFVVEIDLLTLDNTLIILPWLKL